MADDTKRLVFSIIQFLNDQLSSGSLSESQEEIEAAVHCLETAFGVSAADDHQSLAVSRTLPEIFSEVVSKLPSAAAPANHEAEAEQLKADGNAQMQAENFQAAVELYSRAIALSPRNAVYYGNRAAARSKLGNHAGAVQDCEAAIRVDPKYSKAYGRMGTALTSLNRHTEALHFYRKALEMDPGNQTYRSNLAIAEQKVQQQQVPPSPGAGAQGPDLSSMFSVEQLKNMATSLMSNPQINNLMNNPQLQQLVSELVAGGAGGSPPGAPPTDGGSGQAS